MKKLITPTCLLVIFLITTGISLQAQATPNKQEFLSFWTSFKNAIKENDAKFIFDNIVIPFQSEGGYYNTEASLQDVKDNYKQILPPFRREMEFVKFDVVMIEKENAYVWLGYSYEDAAYFYCYKKMDPKGDAAASTYEEKYWFKKFKNTFKFYRTTAGLSSTMDE